MRALTRTAFNLELTIVPADQWSEVTFVESVPVPPSDATPSFAEVMNMQYCPGNLEAGIFDDTAEIVHQYHTGANLFYQSRSASMPTPD